MIRSVKVVVILMFLLCGSALSAGQEIHGMIHEITLTGQQFKLLEVAAAEFNKKGMDVSKYQVSIYQVGASYFVVFSDPDAPETQLGSSPNMAGFEVEIDADYQVLGSHFSR